MNMGLEAPVRSILQAGRDLRVDRLKGGYPKP